MRVHQIHLRGLDLTFVRLNRARVLVDQRALRVELLLGDGILLDQPLVALQIQSGIRQQRLIAPQISLHLLQSGFVGPGIDLRQGVALTNRFVLR